jgi:hypothetical protein
MLVIWCCKSRNDMLLAAVAVHFSRACVVLVLCMGFLYHLPVLLLFVSVYVCMRVVG